MNTHDTLAKDERIDIGSDDAVRRWTKALAVTGVAILDAVEKVGPLERDVRRYLNDAMAGGQEDG